MVSHMGGLAEHEPLCPFFLLRYNFARLQVFFSSVWRWKFSQGRFDIWELG